MLQEQFPAIKEMMTIYIQERERSVRKVHYATISLCGLIVAGAVVLGLKGSPETAEKIIVPLLTFLGGLLVGEKTKSKG